MFRLATVYIQDFHFGTPSSEHYTSNHPQQQPVIAGVFGQPPLFTSLYYTLVSDQLSIHLGKASRRHKLPRLAP